MLSVVPHSASLRDPSQGVPAAAGHTGMEASPMRAAGTPSRNNLSNSNKVHDEKFP